MDPALEGLMPTNAGASPDTASIRGPFGERLVDLGGDGSARGSIHGEQLRDHIADALERWREEIVTRTGSRPDQYVDRFLGATGFATAVAEKTPHLRDEIAAIALASNQPWADVMAYNLMDEQWRHDRDGGVGCSVVGVMVDDGPTLLGQNMDLPSWMDGSQAILRIAPQDGEPEQIVFTAAGMIGLFGVNANGLACCVNTLGDLPGADTGLPVAAVVREVLRHPDAESAGRYLHSVPHASGQHYALADPERLRGYECAADGSTEGPSARHLVHTNHPLWAPGAIAHEGSSSEAHTRNSLSRLQALAESLEELRSSCDVKPVLSSQDSGLCVLPSPQKDALTFCSAEFILTRPPVVRVALGRPDMTPWKIVGWRNTRATSFISDLHAAAQSHAIQARTR